VKVNFVTSSENKVAELAGVLGDAHEVVRLEAELPEVQSLDPHEIISEKLRVAQVMHPDEIIIVEDTSLEVDALNGLPGTFIKFFEKSTGDQGIYLMARGMQSEGALTGRARVVIGLSNDGRMEFFEGVLEGVIVEEQGEGWGFDKIFIPDGYTERLGTLGPEVKSQISHRALATKGLKNYLDSLITGSGAPV